jgi:hypothetical protein
MDNIRAKTGKSPEDFRQIASKRGLLAPGTKAGAIIEWLDEEFGLGRGHAMAIVAVFKQRKWLESPVARKKAKAKRS